MVTKQIFLCLLAIKITVSDQYSGGGNSLRSWQLSHELSSIKTGVSSIDDDLTYLYGQLPGRIKEAALAKMTKSMRKVVTDISVAMLNLFGFLFTGGLTVLTGFTDTNPETPSVGELVSTAGDFFQTFSFVWGRLFGLNKDTVPSCGIDEYVQTWDEFYDAANLRATYSFMSDAPPSYFSGRSGGLNEIDPRNITKQIAQRSGYGSSNELTIVDNLRVETLPAMMEFRVCEMTINLRGALSCLKDDSLLESRILQECIDNIEETSNTRLDVTQRIIDIELELSNLEGKEY